jgi:hypothetical protein
MWRVDAIESRQERYLKVPRHISPLASFYSAKTHFTKTQCLGFVAQPEKQNSQQSELLAVTYFKAAIVLSNLSI